MAITLLIVHCTIFADFYHVYMKVKTNMLSYPNHEIYNTVNIKIIYQ